MVLFWLRTSVAASNMRGDVQEPEHFTGRDPARLVFADVEGLRHQESMDMAQKQYTAQTNSVLIQQQMLEAEGVAVGYTYLPEETE